MLTLGVLISGRGSNLQAILAAIADGRLTARVGVVISNRADAPGLAHAAAAGVPVEVISHRGWPSREQYDQRLVEVLRAHHVSLVCLAGFMRLLTPVLIDAFPSRILNVHPSLLPAFPGLHTHRRALEAGCKVAGATVHFVDAEVDHGPVVMQSAVPVLPDDDEHTLAERVLATEHVILPRAVRWFVEDRLRIEGHLVRQLDGASQLLG